MTSLQFLKALDADDRALLDAARALGLTEARPALPLRRKKLVRTLLIAAVLLSLLGVTAYAADFPGLRALLLPGSQGMAYHAADLPDGERLLTEAPDGGMLSLTQPMALPEDLDPRIAVKVENSAAAWAEWLAWKEAHPFEEPEVFRPPEGTGFSETAENPDGSYTVAFYEDSRWDEQAGRIVGVRLIEVRTATEEEYAADRHYKEVMGHLGIAGYDHSYGVYDEAGAEKLEELAAKYGLALRRERTVLSPQTGEPGPENGDSLETLVELLSEKTCSAPLFNRNPDRIDHASYFQEGSFSLSYSVADASSGEELSCYVCSSPYGTLSSGMEMLEMEGDLTAFQSRTHTAPDGTELTVLFSGETAYFYTWLEKSYFAGRIGGLGRSAAPEAAVTAVLDAIAFTHIGV